jgi:hypothetical protein
VPALNDNNWRRFESRSYEELFDRVVFWIAVLVLLAVVAGCAFAARPFGGMGATLLLARLVRGTGGSGA